MKKGVMLGVLFITILLSTSFISAAWWDFFLKPGPGLSPEDELEGIPQCSDGIDNDGDGKIDALTEGVDKNNCEEIRYSNGETNCDRYGDSYYFGRTKNQENSEIDNFVNSFEEYTNIPSSGNTWCNQITVNQVCKLAGYNTAQIINLRAEGEFTNEGFTACSRDKCNQDSSCRGWHSKGDNHFTYWDESKNDFVNENANGATVGRLNRGIKKLLCTNPISECNDGIDNDGDGKIDLDDSECENAKDNSEVPHDPQCDNLEDNSEADECTDSDGGDNFYTKGYRLTPNRGSSNKEYDFCIFDPFIYPGGSVVSDRDAKVEECGGDKCYLIEYHCKEKKDFPDDYLARAHMGFKCPNGCKDGACIPGKEPYCSAIGSKSEGWYDKNDGFIKYDSHCDEGCVAECRKYDSVKDIIIEGAFYTIELISASDDTATVKITDSTGDSETREINEAWSEPVQGVTVAVTVADETNLKLSATIIVGSNKVTLTIPPIGWYSSCDDRLIKVDVDCSKSKYVILEDFGDIKNTGELISGNEDPMEEFTEFFDDKNFVGGEFTTYEYYAEDFNHVFEYSGAIVIEFDENIQYSEFKNFISSIKADETVSSALDDVFEFEESLGIDNLGIKNSQLFYINENGPEGEEQWVAWSSKNKFVVLAFTGQEQTRGVSDNDVRDFYLAYLKKFPSTLVVEDPKCKSDADCPEWTWDSYCLKSTNPDEYDQTISTGKSFQCSNDGHCIYRDTNVNSKECPYGCEANSCNPKPLCIVGSSESKTFVQRTSTEINGLNILALKSGSTDSELVVRLNAGDRENLILTQSNPKTQVNFRDKTFQVELVPVLDAPPQIRVTCGAVESSDKKIENIWYGKEEGKLSVGYSYTGEKGDVNINLIKENDDGSYEGSECDLSEISCVKYASTRVNRDGEIEYEYSGQNCDLKTSCTYPDANSDVRSFFKVEDSASPWINAVKAIERREDGCKILDGEVSNEIARLRKESYIPSEGREAYPGIHIVTGADGGQIWRVNEVSGTQATFKDTMDLESSPVVVLFNSNGVGKLPLRGGSEAEVQVFNRNEYYSIKVNEKPYPIVRTWGCYPKKSIEFHEGWNLLNMLVAFDLLNLEHPDEGVWNENKVAAVYYYDQENNEYVNIFKDRNKWEKISYKLRSSLEHATFFQSSVWVYFKEDRTVEYEMRSLHRGFRTFGPLNNVVLGPGWNFFSETPEIDGKTPNDIKGDCDLLDVARFDSEIQDWYLFTEDDRENMELGGKDNLLSGFLAKVSEKCQPNIDITPPTPDFPPEDLIPAPPAIPIA